MSISNWYPTQFYKVGDYVYDLSGDYYYAVADNFNDPPPSASWVLVTTGTFAPSYGEFASSTSQPLPAATQTQLTFDAKNLGTPDIIPFGGVFPSAAVQINTTGVYRAIFSVQIDKFGGGGDNEFQFWFQINGVNVPNTNSQLHTTQQIDQIMTIESFFSMTAGQRLGVVGYTPVGSVQDRILAQAVDATHPVSIPSIILNVQRIA